MRRFGTAFAFLTAMTAMAQTVQAPSPKQGRPGEILPWTRFRPRTDPYSPTAEEKQQIQAKIDRLGAMIRGLQAQRADALGVRNFTAAESLPVLIYPNPTPQYGDFAVLRVNEMKEIPDVAYAGLFDESWNLP